jgi:serine/threonine protein phosphatase 1
MSGARSFDQVRLGPAAKTLRQVVQMTSVNLRSRQRSRRSGIPMLRDWLSSRPKASPDSAPPASVPKGVRLYAIGDIHGRPDLLDKVLARIDADLVANPVPEAIEVFVGDYVDRGPGSREVVDRLVTRARTRESICLKGNHEAYLMDFLKNPAVLHDWRSCGGLETLVSYGLTPSLSAQPDEYKKLSQAFDRALPLNHRLFFNGLRSCYVCGDFFFVHAGVRPGVPLEEQSENDLLWIRDDFLNYEGDFGKVIIHGHTPVLRPDIHANRINIDTGGYATGQISCLVIEQAELSFI